MVKSVKQRATVVNNYFHLFLSLFSLYFIDLFAILFYTVQQKGGPVSNEGAFSMRWPATKKQGAKP
jgi:hypothetical protein